ncbi:hypothetical protein RF11_03864 [Thelohanellus kitauei]|uniref:Uncharacterized protein n=1 Tax=Thelohanellus kitauei TaxID=669202 RepID=A0A0C2J5K3_THEKT|nr:hypothetical protein RF11_03864 [Thelohanellus kitauei]
MELRDLFEKCDRSNEQELHIDAKFNEYTLIYPCKPESEESVTEIKSAAPSDEEETNAEIESASQSDDEETNTETESAAQLNEDEIDLEEDSQEIQDTGLSSTAIILIILFTCLIVVIASSIAVYYFFGNQLKPIIMEKYEMVRNKINTCYKYFKNS